MEERRRDRGKVRWKSGDVKLKDGVIEKARMEELTLWRRHELGSLVSTTRYGKGGETDHADKIGDECALGDTESLDWRSRLFRPESERGTEEKNRPFWIGTGRQGASCYDERSRNNSGREWGDKKGACELAGDESKSDKERGYQ